MTDPAIAVVRHVMPAPPAMVYDAWLDPHSLAEWMCPRPARPTTITCDPRVGGAYRFDVEDTETTLTITGRYLHLDPPRRIAFTWYCSVWGPGVPDSIVTVSFEPHGHNETLMTIEHAQLRPDLVDRHRNGWSRIAEQLTAILGRAFEGRA